MLRRKIVALAAITLVTGSVIASNTSDARGIGGGGFHGGGFGGGFRGGLVGGGF
jgi:hypothetical protein